ncbi:hypothetical protein [Metapseudomonas otitidis]|uniref:hypothetical protein n=1 Tax=Metapseudomonas otitidis TaxID=319939 RepID=UPI0013E051AD|nr:hypothetical protein [Pseudomonas otitidis]
MAISSNSQSESLRNAAGSMELKEGTGPIIATFTSGDILELYKCDKTFRLQTPEVVDPEETNPNAPWVAIPIADVGTNNLTIARVLLQNCEMLEAASFDGELDRGAIKKHLHVYKDTLLYCEKLVDRISSGIDEVLDIIKEKGVSLDNGGRGLNPLPQVSELEMDCASLLVQANRAIKNLCEFPSLFLALDRIDSNFDHLYARLERLLGEDAPVVIFVRDNRELIRYLVDLRNFQEHPKEVRTIIKNFHVLPGGGIQVPVWYVEGRGAVRPVSIKDEAHAILALLRDLGEGMFIHLLMARLNTKLPYILYEISDEDIRLEFPIKYRLTLDFGRLNAAKDA